MQEATNALNLGGLWLCCKIPFPGARKGAETFDIHLILRISV